MLHQQNIFNTHSDKAGFRLQIMEIYNWGTFDNEIVKISPLGNNSLLTGANGSGKTTFIDALLTLLVPTKKDRFYNQSSGVVKKGDRNERSYVLGHYGDIQKEGDLSTTTQKLRDEQTVFSVLLATFKSDEEKIITLFQARNFSNGQLKVTFGLAHKTLSIAEDFSGFDAQGKWKKRLEERYNISKKVIEYFDGVNKYADRIANQFGMRSTKALSLFNQVVGIKVLGDLNEFIKTNMLEARDAEAKYIELRESFITLSSAKNNIDKAKEQIQQLESIDKIANQLSTIETELKQLQSDKEIAVYWFASQGIKVCDEENIRLDDLFETTKDKISSLNDTLDELSGKESDLKVQIESSDIGRQIKDLDEEIKRIEGQRDTKKGTLEEYNKLTKKLELTFDPDEATFIKNRDFSKEQKQVCIKELKEKNEDLGKARNSYGDIGKENKDAINIIEVLRKNDNNISGRVAEIRDEILLAIGAKKEEIPFIGELIKVEDEDTVWQSVIEKVLHNFALQLIVPDKYYQKVNQYVNKTNLKGRIVYQRYQEFNTLNEMVSKNVVNNKLINKISFKVNHPYSSWIKDRINNQFDYVCTKNLQEFDQLERALTQEGLIKFGKGKHEKDDRKHINSPKNYVLGWDNKEKIKLLVKNVSKLQKQQEDIKSSIETIEDKIDSIDDLKDNYHDLFELYTKYSVIDWQTYASNIQDKTEERDALETSDNGLKVLRQQLKTVGEDIEKISNKKENGSLDERKKEKYDIEGEINKLVLRQQEHQKILATIPKPETGLSEFEANNAHLLKIDYAGFSQQQKQFQDVNKELIVSFTSEKNNLTVKVSSKINRFKNPPEEILNCYKTWASDVSSLPVDIDFISEYQTKYQNLIKEGLPEYEEKFNKYLEETILGKMFDFHMFFESWRDDIDTNISNLNDSLKSIDFKNSPNTTYIQLTKQEKSVENIKKFRNFLQNTIANINEINISIDSKKNHFEENIEPFIKKLEDENWRKKIMDVRAWFEYKAEEFYKENNQKFKTYTGMGQLSGGEKAQLTYTILGAAIAYQFGLTKSGIQSKSFRFIAIDEAFKAQDADKAQYLLTLCKQLHLQLLVVTPSDNIHIVEDYISFVHWVERRNSESSMLLDMTITQFQKEKQHYLDDNT